MFKTLRRLKVPVYCFHFSNLSFFPFAPLDLAMVGLHRWVWSGRHFCLIKNWWCFSSWSASSWHWWDCIGQEDIGGDSFWSFIFGHKNWWCFSHCAKNWYLCIGWHCLVGLGRRTLGAAVLFFAAKTDVDIPLLTLSFSYSWHLVPRTDIPLHWLAWDYIGQEDIGGGSF